MRTSLNTRLFGALISTQSINMYYVDKQRQLQPIFPFIPMKIAIRTPTQVTTANSNNCQTQKVPVSYSKSHLSRKNKSFPL